MISRGLIENFSLSVDDFEDEDMDMIMNVPRNQLEREKYMGRNVSMMDSHT